MRLRLIWSASIAAALAGSICTGGAEPSSVSSSVRLTPLVAYVLNPPHAVPGSDRRTHLVYEIRIANATDKRVSLKRIAVVDGRAGTTLATMGAKEIGGRGSTAQLVYVEPGAEDQLESTLRFFLSPRSAYVSGQPVTTLAHAVEASFEQPAADFSMRLAETSVVATAPPALGPPLRGRGFIAGDGCCDSIRHVRALRIC